MSRHGAATAALALLVGGLLATPSSSNAQITHIDFSSLACASGPGGANAVPSPLTLNGYTFTHATGHSFGTWCQNSPHYPGSAALFNGLGNSTMTLTKAGGGAFGIDAISLAQLYSDQIDDVSIVFTGLLPNAFTVTQTFSFLAHPGRPTLASYIFDPSFDNVVSVSWDQGSDDLHQFDDIFVHATPEPGSFVLLASGLIAMAGASFKRRRSV